MIKQFQINVDKRFVNFQSRAISLCNALTDRRSQIRKSKINGISCAISLTVERFGNTFFNKWKFRDEKNIILPSVLFRQDVHEKEGVP